MFEAIAVSIMVAGTTTSIVLLIVAAIKGYE